MDLPRRLLLAGLAGATLRPGAAAVPATLAFPRDHGSHPDTRTEWWYITGHARAGTGTQARDLGFQITFFRARVDGTQAMASRFAARQLLFAHAAVTDVQAKRFWHDQRVARGGSGVAEAGEQDTAIRLRDWSLLRQGDEYVAHLVGADFTLDLRFAPTQAVLLQGENGWSRKGPEPGQASHYYSQPQMAFDGQIVLQGQKLAVAGGGARATGSQPQPNGGAAWLDHEWSDGLMHPAAVGWDWIGMNLFDGSALMAFQMRDKAGKPLWDGGAFRHPRIHTGAAAYRFSRGEVEFQPLRYWKSPLTQASYPVEWRVRTPADFYLVQALLDGQELDSRGSTGAVYWEGLCDLLDSNRQRVGRGYLEMTGYAKPLVL